MWRWSVDRGARRRWLRRRLERRCSLAFRHLEIDARFNLILQQRFWLVRVHAVNVRSLRPISILRELPLIVIDLVSVKYRSRGSACQEAGDHKV